MKGPRQRRDAFFTALEIPWRDPLDAFDAIADREWPVLLDSAGPIGPRSRWCFVACDPFETLIANVGSTVENGRQTEPTEAFRALQRLLTDYECEPATQAICDGVRPPFHGGAIGFVSYDAVDELERIPDPANPERRAPDLAFGMYGAIAAFDRERQRGWVISNSLSSSRAAVGRSLSIRHGQALSRLIGSGDSSERGAGTLNHDVHSIESAEDPPVQAAARSEVEEAVSQVVRYVHAGDIFQANISQRFDVENGADESVAALYRRAREATPAPFGACLDVAGLQIVSVSPERFIRSDGERIETCPIKGTRSRREIAAEDEAEATALQESEKDRAENVMIVDLMRNDLSRVCQDGSVGVDALCSLERHPTVHHLVSTISGRLRPGVGPTDILRATFPAGSITGAPKVRAMEIISELEGERRGVYCGSIGYIGFDGVMDLNVAIRTIVVQDGRARVRAGGGIVADSTPRAEYDEMLDKARAPLAALGVTAPAERTLAGTVQISKPPLAGSPLASAPLIPQEARRRAIAGNGADGGGLHLTSLSNSRPSRPNKVLLIDNYDSFVHTVARYLGELGAERIVARNDAISLDDITNIDPTHIVISPGPRTPADAGISIDVVRAFGASIPILGICLGHQAIAEAYGGRVVEGTWPMHGRRSEVTHDGRGVFEGLPSPLGVGRYHSLVIEQATLPACLEVNARTEDDVIMAVRHREHPVVGVQFHPESVLTDHGHELLWRFLSMSKQAELVPHERATG